MQRHWFKGDTHLHTLNSDGHLHQYELIERCKKLGLDYIIITDHNYDTVEKSYSSDGLLVIKGQEVTGDNGHVNIWGENVGFKPPYDLSNLHAYKKIAAKAKKNGATISVIIRFAQTAAFCSTLTICLWIASRFGTLFSIAIISKISIGGSISSTMA